MIFIDIPQIVPMKMGLLAAPGLPKAEAQRPPLQRRHQLLSGQRVHVDAIGRQQDATNCDLGLQRDSQFQLRVGKEVAEFVTDQDPKTIVQLAEVQNG